jgi:DNA-binding YbaB/EbfC family protein
MFKGGMASMMQKAQKMQQNVKTAQAEIKNLNIAGKSGTQVVVNMNGEYQVQSINIADEVMQDKELLIDMMRIAINDATTQIQDISAAKMQEATGGLNLPL